jgi:hypothetical protein
LGLFEVLDLIFVLNLTIFCPFLKNKLGFVMIVKKNKKKKKKITITTTPPPPKRSQKILKNHCFWPFGPKKYKNPMFKNAIKMP